MTESREDSGIIFIYYVVYFFSDDSMSISMSGHMLLGHARILFATSWPKIAGSSSSFCRMSSSLSISIWLMLFLFLFCGRGVLLSNKFPLSSVAAVDFWVGAAKLLLSLMAALEVALLGVAVAKLPLSSVATVKLQLWDVAAASSTSVMSGELGS